MAPVHQQTRFLFINKDARSEALSRSTGQTALAISQHAQRSQVLANRQKRNQALKTGSIARKIAAAGWTRRETTSPEFGETKIEETEAEETEIEAEAAASKALLHIFHSPRIASANFKPGDAVDPFSSTVMPINEAIFCVLQYHLSYSVVSTFRSEALATRRPVQYHRYYSVIKDVVRSCMSDKLHMSSLIAATASRMSIFLISPMDRRFRSMALGFIQKATREMHSSLFAGCETTAPNAQIMLDVFYLCVAEWYLEDYDAALIHLKFLKHWFRTLDLRLAFHRYVFDLITFHDVFIAIETGGMPIFPLPSWEAPDLPPARSRAICTELDLILSTPRKRPLWDPRAAFTSEEKLLGGAGPLAYIAHPPIPEEARFLGREIAGAEQRPALGFSEACEAGLFGEGMADVIAHYVLLVEVTTVVFLSPIQPSAADVEWMHRKATSVLYRLLLVGLTRADFPYKGAPHKNSPLPPKLRPPISPTLFEAQTPSISPSVEEQSPTALTILGECARLALIIVLSYGPTPLAWRAAKVNMFRLQAALKSFEALHSSTANSPSLIPCHEDHGGIQDQLMLWILTICIFAAGTFSEEAEWFTVRAVFVANRLDVRTYIELHRTVGRFAHADTYHYATLSMLAARIAAAKAA